MGEKTSHDLVFLLMLTDKWIHTQTTSAQAFPKDIKQMLNTWNPQNKTVGIIQVKTEKSKHLLTELDWMNLIYLQEENQIISKSVVEEK